ncbi:patatin-like phospholipase family protein [Chelatococcus sp. GCM10030263]|uniref:patatin-like phospholipase family protein n=1 Tax=Chelatococcus sp. GCM10030263 TaxID=3273387 RepID=UPI00360F8607
MKRTAGGIILSIVILGAVAKLSACEPLPRLNHVSQAEKGDITVLGLSDIRYWGDEVTPQMVAGGLASYRREQDYATATGHAGPLPPAQYLAISGGGDNGAFGAGLLVGWTAAGTRPTFKVVTGISTGALIAPFAFLGAAYDDQLQQIYTEISAKDVLERRWILSALFDDAIAASQPLHQTIARFITPAILQAIAREHEKGRLLLVATTDLDAGRPVIWNIGKIAASGHPGALKLIQNLMLASAAIPIIFPPVMIDVEVGGKQYQEMHVDGGATTQVIVYPPGLRVNDLGITRERRLYVIRNARLDIEWVDVDRQILSIARRAMATMIETQGIGDLYRIYSLARRDGIDFNLASIPRTFKMKRVQLFNTRYMKALFQYGYNLGEAGYSWAKVPPGYGGTDPRVAPTALTEH